jgi:hypothetical protein
MRQTVRALAACLAIALVPSPALAWGFAAQTPVLKPVLKMEVSRPVERVRR